MLRSELLRRYPHRTLGTVTDPARLLALPGVHFGEVLQCHGLSGKSCLAQPGLQERISKTKRGSG